MNRRPTPSIIDAVLVADVAPDRTALRTRLRWDYSQVAPVDRKAVEDAAVDILANGQRMKESAVVVGERLLGVKQLLDHGQFSDWCSVEFDMSQRTAQNMMNVARQFGGAEKRNTVALLSDSALYLLTAPSTPESAREAVIAEAQTTGKSPTKAQVKKIISAHKPEQESQRVNYTVADIDKLDEVDRVYSVQRRVDGQIIGDHDWRIAYSGKLPSDGHYVVYGLVDPRDGEVFYVGRTGIFETRLRQHCIRGGAKYLAQRKNEIADAGELIRAEILEWCANDNEAAITEARIIETKYPSLANLKHETIAQHKPGPVPAPIPAPTAREYSAAVQADQPRTVGSMADTYVRHLLDEMDAEAALDHVTSMAGARVIEQTFGCQFSIARLVATAASDLLTGILDRQERRQSAISNQQSPISNPQPVTVDVLPPSDAPLPSWADEPAPTHYTAGQPHDERLGRAQRLMALYGAVVDSEEEYGQLTGRFSDTLAMKRELTHLMSHLSDLIAIIQHPEEVTPDA